MKLQPGVQIHLTGPPRQTLTIRWIQKGHEMLVDNDLLVCPTCHKPIANNDTQLMSGNGAQHNLRQQDPVCIKGNGPHAAGLSRACSKHGKNAKIVMLARVRTFKCPYGHTHFLAIQNG